MTLYRKLEDEIVDARELLATAAIVPEPKPEPETPKSRRNAYMATYMRLYRAKKKRALQAQPQ